MNKNNSKGGLLTEDKEKTNADATNNKASTSTQQASAEGKQSENANANPNDEIKKAIDAAFEKKRALILRINRLKGRLEYKKSEEEALAKLVGLNDAYKNIGKLRHMKEVLEFKISTEARTLDDEKALLKRLEGVEAQLNEAIAASRLKKKAELVHKDVEELEKGMEEANKEIDAINKQIAELKSKLAGTRHKPEQRRRRVQAPPVEISLQDIAIIKTKKNKNGNAENTAGTKSTNENASTESGASAKI